MKMLKHTYLEQMIGWTYTDFRTMMLCMAVLYVYVS